MNAEVESARVRTDSHHDHPTLFPLSEFSTPPTSPPSLCKQIGLNWMTALELHRQGRLSFDPKSVKVLDPVQRAELSFVGALASAGCDRSVLENLLSGLRKPYAYHIDRLYYDWVTRSWRLLEDVDELEDKFYEWVDELIGAQDLEVLERLLQSIERSTLYLRGRRGLPHRPERLKVKCFKEEDEGVSLLAQPYPP